MNDSKKLAPVAKATMALGMATPLDPVTEMEMERMKEVVTRRQEFDRSIDKVLKKRIPAQGKKGNVLPLRLHPDQILTEVCDPIENFDTLTRGPLKELIADMAFTMYLCGGAGLAAPQVGLKLRLFVMDVDARGGGKANLQVFLNPEVLSTKNPVCMEEGCLSMPGLKPRITRHNDIVVVARTRKGAKVERRLNGWNARVFLHELDHLNGKTMLDRVSSLELMYAKKKLARIRKNIEGKTKDRRKPKQRRR